MNEEEIERSTELIETLNSQIDKMDRIFKGLGRTLITVILTQLALLLWLLLK